MSEEPIRNNLIVEMHVPDFKPVRDFYGAFGFEEILYLPKSPILDYMVLNREDPELGNTQLHFYGGGPEIANQSFFRRFPKDTRRGYAVEFTIPVSNLDQLWEEVIPIVGMDMVVQPLKEREWGGRDFRLEGPFGYYIRISENLEWGQANLPKQKQSADQTHSLLR